MARQTSCRLMEKCHRISKQNFISFLWIFHQKIQFIEVCKTIIIFSMFFLSIIPSSILVQTLFKKCILQRIIWCYIHNDRSKSNVLHCFKTKKKKSKSLLFVGLFPSFSFYHLAVKFTFLSKIQRHVEQVQCW